MTLTSTPKAHPAEGVLLRWQELSWFPVLVMAGKHSLWRWHWVHIGRELASDLPGREWMGRDKVRKTPSWPRSWANFSLF